MHYVVPANFLGLPALSVPVGVLPCSLAPAAASSTDCSRPLLLPVSLQLMAPCYHEASLLHAGAVLEAAVAAGGSAVPVPQVWFDVLAPVRPSSSRSGR
jgi:Asp-tRNA(Asn)/Glu-tRNA(Gln) amidotransferase A subunit family amidase